MLKHVLISRQGSGVTSTIKENLDVSCSITGKDPKASLTISLRTRVEDITQRLGSIELPQTSNTEDVDLFSWTSQAIEQRDNLQTQASKDQDTAGKSTQAIGDLQAQLDDLTKAKTEHEDELLAKFAALLNEKKLRLRELARQLSTGKVDKRALERLEAALPPSESAGKRGKKRSAKEAKHASESEESDGFEAMDVDKPADDAQVVDSDEDRRTTDNETETASDDDDLDKPVTSQTETGSAGRSQLPPKEQSAGLPPTRDLPFSRQAKKDNKELPPKHDEDTASEDDDEL